MKMTLFSNIDFYCEFIFRILLVCFFFVFVFGGFFWVFFSFSWVIFCKTFYVQELRTLFPPFCYYYFCRVVRETPALRKITTLHLHFTTFANSPCFRFEPRFELQSEANKDSYSKMLLFAF